MTARPIALDAMGGDHAPSATVEGACRAVGDGLPVVLVGDEKGDRPRIPKGIDIDIVHASEAVGMDEAPVCGGAAKKTPVSVWLPARWPQGDASAVVSFGNTGALMAASSDGVGPIDGVKARSDCHLAPQRWGEVVILDLGANVDQSQSFGPVGVMGSVFATDVLRLKASTCGHPVERRRRRQRQRASSLGHARVGTDADSLVGPVEPSDACRGLAKWWCAMALLAM